jgi:hypothetical protein
MFLQFLIDIKNSNSTKAVKSVKPSTTRSTRTNLSNYTNFEKFYKTIIFGNSYKNLPSRKITYKTTILGNSSNIDYELFDNRILRLYELFRFESQMPVLNSQQMAAIHSNKN